MWIIRIPFTFSILLKEISDDGLQKKKTIFERIKEAVLKHVLLYYK